MMPTQAPPAPNSLAIPSTLRVSDIVPPGSVDISRTIYNPIQCERVTFVKTADETSGVRTQVEVELAPGGGDRLHYHPSHSERFTPITGVLSMQIGKTKHMLRPGESVRVKQGVRHRFYNATEEPIRFLVDTAPGNDGFEQALRIAYGLARDGQISMFGVPKNPLMIALLAELSDTRIVGLLGVFNPFFGFLANLARQRDLDAYLMVRYAPHTTDNLLREKD